MYWFKRKYQQIQRVLDYLPIIWKGFDFDYTYATELYGHQLGRIANFLESDRAHTMCAKDNAKRIRTTLKLMKLVGDEEYATEYFNYEEVENYFVPLKAPEGYCAMETDYISETYDDFFKKYPLIYNKVVDLGLGPFSSKEGDTDFKIKRIIAMNIAHLNHERARTTLYKLIERNQQNWWD